MGAVVVQQGWGTTGAGFTVTQGTICLPRIGAWHADLAVDSPAALTGKVTLRIADKLSLRGTINRGGQASGMSRIRVVAGADGLRKTATPKHYTSPVLTLPLRQILEDAGETLSDTVVIQEAAVMLAWTTISAPTGAMVRGLMDLAPTGTAWRFLPDGSFWCGPETWPESDADEVRELTSMPEDGTVSIGLDVPNVLPGTTINGGQKVDYVEHVVSRDNLRSTAWISDGDLPTDRVKAGLVALTGGPPALMDYRSWYRVRVLSQSSDLRKVDVRPDDPRLPDMSNITVKPGVPWAKVSIESNAYAMLSWESGRPDKPFVSVWESDSTVQVLTDGVLNGMATDLYSGLKHWQIGNASAKIFVKK